MHVHLNQAALERHLKSAQADEKRRQLAEAIADRVRAQHIQVGAVEASDPDPMDIPVDVSEAGNVFLAHPAGQAVEAKYGALVKAAADLGVEVHR